MSYNGEIWESESTLIKPNFGIINFNLSSTKKASDSDICWREFLVAMSNFNQYCSERVKEDEISEITKSLQNWTMKKNSTDYREKDVAGIKQNYDPSIGEIYLADLGMSYETAYSHPILILEKIGNKLLIVPCTSNAEKIRVAFHPATLTTGDKNLRKVLVADGFAIDSALMLNCVMIISKGRLLERKGSINGDINDPLSSFGDIKQNVFEMLFNRKFSEFEKMKEENIALKEDGIALKEENIVLLAEIASLKKQTQLSK